MDGYQPTGLRHEHDIVGDYPQGQSTDDLSDGEIAGIVIGSVIGAAILIALVVYFVKKNKDESDLPK